ncbi:MAG: hypothetical protein FWC20_05805 [Oscillospiraceae bacterium]|nr:hypothetical protein [Oscillospiraceae bacterium]MCL2278908.1 hypothetical protein [Oscillospiraceae bacterium]
MRIKKEQMSLIETYEDVCLKMEESKPEFLSLLDEHIDFTKFIPADFIWAFYRRNGRRCEYTLEGFLKFCILQKVLGIEEDSVLITVLKMSCETIVVLTMCLMARKSQGSNRILCIT